GGDQRGGAGQAYAQGRRAGDPSLRRVQAHGVDGLRPGEVEVGEVERRRPGCGVGEIDERIRHVDAGGVHADEVSGQGGDGDGEVAGLEIRLRDVEDLQRAGGDEGEVGVDG